MSAPPVAPFPSTSGQIISHLVWVLMPLGVCAYLLVLPAVRRSLAEHLTRALDYVAPRQPPAAPPANRPADPAAGPAPDPSVTADAPPPADADAKLLSAVLTAWQGARPGDPPV